MNSSSNNSSNSNSIPIPSLNILPDTLNSGYCSQHSNDSNLSIPPLPSPTSYQSDNNHNNHNNHYKYIKNEVECLTPKDEIDAEWRELMEIGKRISNEHQDEEKELISWLTNELRGLRKIPKANGTENGNQCSNKKCGRKIDLANDHIVEIQIAAATLHHWKHLNLPGRFTIYLAKILSSKANLQILCSSCNPSKGRWWTGQLQGEDWNAWDQKEEFDKYNNAFDGMLMDIEIKHNIPPKIKILLHRAMNKIYDRVNNILDHKLDVLPV